MHLLKKQHQPDCSQHDHHLMSLMDVNDERKVFFSSKTRELCLRFLAFGSMQLHVIDVFKARSRFSIECRKSFAFVLVLLYFPL